MKVVNIAQRTDEWHVWRKGGVTGTDVSILLGQNEDKTIWRLWAEKMGKVQPEDLSGNPNVKRGVALEPVARDAIEEKHGLVLMPFCGQHEDFDFLRVSFDGVDDDGRPVEIKCPGDKVWASIKEKGEQSPEYLRYYTQVQHQILVAGSECALLVFFYEGELMEFLIKADPELHQEIIDASISFMEMLKKKKEPPKDPLRDIFVPEGAERSQWKTFATKRREYSQVLKEIEGNAKSIKAEITKMDDELIQIMGPFMKAEADGVAITRYVQQGNVDWKALITELLPDLELTDELLAKYRGKESSRTRVTETDTEETEQKVVKLRQTKPAKKKEEAPEPASVYAW